MRSRRSRISNSRSKSKKIILFSFVMAVIAAAALFVFPNLSNHPARTGDTAAPPPLSASEPPPTPIVSSPSSPVEGPSPRAWPEVKRLTAAQKQRIINQLSSMSTDEKVGQLVIAGMEGTKPNAFTDGLIRNYHIGGFILFRPNIQSAEQTVSLLNRLKEVNRSAGGIPLMLGVDEEGGRVSRLPPPIIGVPGSGQIGSTGNPNYARDIGALLARRVKAFGFNVDFAPVVDVNSNPDNPVIGDRSFSSSAPVVARMGTEEIKGLKSENVMSVIKHFPGHGDTSVDSHKQLPISNNGIERLQQIELPPFKAAIDEDADAVMVAHILLPKLDPHNPSSLSKIIITDLLRGKLGFQGLVISDDLTMGAIQNNGSVGDAAVRSLAAGGDIVLVCHGDDNVLHALQALRNAVDTGTLTSQRLNESVYRILSRKALYGMNDHPITQISVRQY